MNKAFLASIFSVFATSSFAAASTAATPIFIITPNLTAPKTIYSGETTAAVYQVLNNTNYTLNNIGLADMPAGVTPNTSSVSSYSDYCTNPFSLAPGASCLLKANINTTGMSGGLTDGPIACYSQSNPVFCAQPYKPQQIDMTILEASIPQDCQSNVANFNDELTQNLDSSTSFTAGWGPQRLAPSLSPANPNLTNCPATAGIAWDQQRVLAAAAYIISLKLNYCHHYNPDYATPPAQQGAAGNAGGYCNPAVDSYPGTFYYNQQARWNYSGSDGETLQNWVNGNRMWYGVDCTNYTAFLYEFSFGTNTTLGIPFDSKTSLQAGQTSAGCVNGKNCTQDNLSPNTQQLMSMILNNPTEAGVLVCWDGTVDPNPNSPTYCAGHGGYLSSINSSDYFDQPAVTINDLVPNGVPILHPGDILYIAGAGPDHQDQPDGNSTSIVTHGIIWTGKQVGYGPNDINPILIAPDDAPCASQSIWQPTIGSWVITDSHYQGPDYRVLTQCFYLNDLWGVRRVIR